MINIVVRTATGIVSCLYLKHMLFKQHSKSQNGNLIGSLSTNQGTSVSMAIPTSIFPIINPCKLVASLFPSTTMIDCPFNWSPLLGTMPTAFGVMCTVAVICSIQMLGSSSSFTMSSNVKLTIPISSNLIPNSSDSILIYLFLLLFHFIFEHSYRAIKIILH